VCVCNEVGVEFVVHGCVGLCRRLCATGRAEWNWPEFCSGWFNAVEHDGVGQIVCDRDGCAGEHSCAAPIAIVGKGYEAAGQVGVGEDVGANVGCAQGACGYGSDVAAIGQIDP
jgi:hypothetical protein